VERTDTSQSREGGGLFFAAKRETCRSGNRRDWSTVSLLAAGAVARGERSRLSSLAGTWTQTTEIRRGSRAFGSGLGPRRPRGEATPPKRGQATRCRRDRRPETHDLNGLVEAASLGASACSRG
jgi:hypothetical protein